MCWVNMESESHGLSVPEFVRGLHGMLSQPGYDHFGATLFAPVQFMPVYTGRSMVSPP